MARYPLGRRAAFFMNISRLRRGLISPPPSLSPPHKRGSRDKNSLPYPLDSRSPIRDEDRFRGNDKKQGLQIINVCDAKPYEFNTIIRVFKESGIRPNRTIISVPLSPVWLATRIAGSLFPNKRNWLHSCYNKLASSLIFDNKKMLGTGFKPVHSLVTVFLTEN